MSFLDIVSKFNQQADSHSKTQSLNPFSDHFDQSRSPSPRFSREDYGKPVAGSKTDLRGRKAKSHVCREILELCTVIHDVGTYNAKKRDPDDDDDDDDYVHEDQNDGTIIVSFGELFQIYTKISDKVVGLLIAAKRRGFVYFDREILFQRRDDDVLIALLKPISEISKLLKDDINQTSTPAAPVEPAPAVEKKKPTSSTGKTKRTKPEGKNRPSEATLSPDGSAADGRKTNCNGEDTGADDRDGLMLSNVVGISESKEDDGCDRADGPAETSGVIEDRAKTRENDKTKAEKDDEDTETEQVHVINSKKTDETYKTDNGDESISGENVEDIEIEQVRVTDSENCDETRKTEKADESEANDGDTELEQVPVTDSENIDETRKIEKADEPKTEANDQDAEFEQLRVIDRENIDEIREIEKVDGTEIREFDVIGAEHANVIEQVETAETEYDDETEQVEKTETEIVDEICETEKVDGTETEEFNEIGTERVNVIETKQVGETEENKNAKLENDDKTEAEQLDETKVEDVEAIETRELVEETGVLLEEVAWRDANYVQNEDGREDTAIKFGGGSEKVDDEMKYISSFNEDGQ